MTRAKVKTFARGFLLWVVGSLFAVLVLEYSAVLGFLLAAAFGIAAGILLFRGYSIQ